MPKPPRGVASGKPPLGRTGGLTVEDGTNIHPSTRAHPHRLEFQAPPDLKASRPTRISKDGKVVPQLKLHDLTPEQQERVRQVLSDSEAFSPDDGAGSLADLLGHAVGGDLGFVAQLAADGNEDAAALLDSWEGSYTGTDSSDGFWDYYASDADYR